MTRSEARTAIKAATDHDGASDTQVTTTQLDTWIDLEHKLLRRQLSLIVPTLYTSVDEEQTLTSTDEDDDVLSVPSDFERLVRVERQVGTAWHPVPVSDELSPHVGSNITVREEGEELRISPLTSAPGVYRIVYVAIPATMDDDADTLDVPAGCEDIILEKVAARVRIRLDQDPSPHSARAAETWLEQKKALRRRYGKMAVPGLRMTRRW
jgi:hypothetical protein